jgi:hypothetical protein
MAPQPMPVPVPYGVRRASGPPAPLVLSGVTHAAPDIQLGPGSQGAHHGKPWDWRRIPPPPASDQRCPEAGHRSRQPNSPGSQSGPWGAAWGATSCRWWRTPAPRTVVVFFHKPLVELHPYATCPAVPAEDAQGVWFGMTGVAGHPGGGADETLGPVGTHGLACAV